MDVVEIHWNCFLDKVAREKHTFISSTEPVKTGEWWYAQSAQPPWNRVTHTEHLHLLRVQILHNLQLSIPDAALFDLLEIEIDADITKR